MTRRDFFKRLASVAAVAAVVPLMTDGDKTALVKKLNMADAIEEHRALLDREYFSVPMTWSLPSQRGIR